MLVYRADHVLHLPLLVLFWALVFCVGGCWTGLGAAQGDSSAWVGAAMLLLAGLAIVWLGTSRTRRISTEAGQVRVKTLFSVREYPSFGSALALHRNYSSNSGSTYILLLVSGQSRVHLAELGTKRGALRAKERVSEVIYGVQLGPESQASRAASAAAREVVRVIEAAWRPELREGGEAALPKRRGGGAFVYVAFAIFLLLLMVGFVFFFAASP